MYEAVYSRTSTARACRLRSRMRTWIYLKLLQCFARCPGDKPLLQFVCEIVPDALKEKQPPSVVHTTSFYASIVSGAIKAGGEEALVATILPHILDNARSGNVELRATSYMLIAQLALHTSMGSELIAALLECIAESLADPLIPDAVKCVVLMCQTQHVPSLPAGLEAFVTTSDKFTTIMEDLSEQFDATALLKLVLKAKVDAMAGSSDAVDRLVVFINAITLTADLTKFLGAIVIKRFQGLTADGRRKKAGKRVAEETGKILDRLEKMYPAAVDALLAKSFASTTESEDGKGSTELLKLLGGSARHNGVPGEDATLFMGLQHPEPSVRATALRHLKDTLASGGEISDADRAFFQTALRAGLDDTEKTVVLSTLSLGKWLVELVDSDVLFASLSQIVGGKMRGKKGLKCLCAAIDVLAGPFADANQDDADAILLVLLPHFFATAKGVDSYATTLKATFKSNILAKCALLAGVKKAAAGLDAADPDAHAAINAKIVAAMAANLAKAAKADDWKTVDALCHAAGESPAATGQLRQMVLLIISKAALGQTDTDHGFRRRILALVQPMIAADAICDQANSKTKRVSGDETATVLWERTIKATATAWDHPSTAELRATVVALEHLVCLVRSTPPLDAGMKGTSDVEFYVTIFATLASRQSSHAMTTLMEWFFLRLVAACPLQFLKHCWCSDTPLIVQVRSLHLTNAYIRSCAELNTSADVVSKLVGLVPYLAVALLESEAAVREAAVACFVKLHAVLDGVESAKNSSTGSMLRLVNLAHSSKKELKTDAAAFPALLAQHMGKKDSPAFNDKDVVVQVFLEAAVASSHSRTACALIQAVAGVSSGSKVTVLWPALQGIVGKASAAGQSYDVLSVTELAIAQAAFEGVNKKTIKLLTAKKAKHFTVLMQALQHGAHTETLDEHPQTWALDLLMRDMLFDSFPSESREQIFTTLCELFSQHSNNKIVTQLKQVIASVPINVHMIVQELHRRLVSTVPEEKSSTSSKRRRVGAAGEAKKADSESEQVTKLRSTAPILDMLQFKDLKTIMKRSQLTAPLFDILESCLALSAAAQPPLEHVKQTVLDSLSILCRFGGGKSFKEEHINTDLIVQCIKQSPSAQTHRHALLLLASVATKYPQKVLDAIMPIFTFMGTDMLRRDDNHSFYIIEKTIETIIPVVVSNSSPLASGAASDDSSARVTGDVVAVVGVFVDAYAHVPKHRRQALFTYLLKALGPERYLFVVTALLLKRVVLTKQATSGEAAPQVFCLAVARQFSVHDQMQAINSLLQLLSDLPDKPDDAASMPVDSSAAIIFNAASHTPKELRHFKYRIVCHLSSNLSTDSFIKARRMFERDASDDGAMTQLRELHFNTLELALSYVLRQRNIEESSMGSAKFHAQLTEHAYNIVDHLNALLSIGDFVEVVIRLLGHQDILIREKVVVLLTERVSQTDQSSAEERLLFLKTIDSLVKVAKTHVSGKASQDKNRQTLCQAAVYALTVLVVHFGRQNTELFAPVLDTAVSILKSKRLAGQFEVLASASACVGALSMAFNKTVLPMLPQIVPCLLGILQPGKASAAASSSADAAAGYPPALLQGSVASSLAVLLKHVPQFLGPYMKEILRTLTHESLAVDAPADSDRGAAVKKAAGVRSTLSTNVPSRILLPPLYALYTEQVKSSNAGEVHSIVQLMEILSTSITQIKRSDIDLHYKQLFKFFLTALDSRGTLKGQMDVDSQVVEASVIRAFVKLVLQLSEKAFVPLLLKLIDWSGRLDASVSRQVTFLRSMSLLVTELKALFVPYFGYFLKRIIAVLEDAPGMFKDAPALVPEATTYTLTAMQHCFTHDTDAFMNNERFASLLVPLAKQLACGDHEDLEAYHGRMEREVIPCLSVFPRTVNDQVLWKDFNNELLSKLQDSQAHVREATLRVFEEIFKVQGDDFLNFLPDTVPLLVELLEDDSEVVELQCKKLVHQIEKILGESIQSYF